MALFLRQDQERTEVQRRVAAQLEQRLKSQQPDLKQPEPSMIEGHHKTRNAGLLIAALVAVAVIVLIVSLSK